jgi:endonuclease/exonuclease/phosphatase family metal-dependent hydrolase
MYRFTVATINLHGRMPHWSARRHLLVGQLVDAQPTVVALQGIGPWGGQDSWVARQVNIRLTGDGKQPYRALYTRPSKWHRSGNGAAVLTRLPILYHESIFLAYDGAALRANLELPAGAAGTRRQSFDFVSVHLFAGPAGGEARLRQAMELVGRLAENRRVPLQVLAGDFGESPEGQAAVFLRQTYRSAYGEVRGRDPLATYPTQPGLPIGECLDYVFLSPAVNRTVTAAIFGDKTAAEDNTLYASDHVGLMVELEV